MNKKDAAAKTRQVILLAAQKEIHRHGFQKAGLDAILARTGVTKGALYHHFPNKKALGYAVVDEVIAGVVEVDWLACLSTSEDPLTSIGESIITVGKKISHEDVLLGCPLNNLCLEMAPIDEGFRLRVNSVYELWRKVIAKALLKGQGSGTVNLDSDPYDTAVFIVASLAGCRSLAKSSQSRELMKSCALTLITFLETLRHERS